MLQEFLPEIEAGELSFVFVRGQFAHPVLKRPARGEFRVNSQFRPLKPVRADPSRTLISDGAAVVALLEHAVPLYTRIDGVIGQERLICTEVELCDPSLFMDIVPNTAHLLADATIEAIRAH